MEGTVTSKKSLFEFKSIKTKLTVIIVVMLIVAGTTLVGIAALMASSALEESMIETLDAIGDGTSQKLEIMAQDGKDTVSIFAADPKIASWLSSWNEGTLTQEERVDASAQLKATLSVVETFDRYNVVDNQGILVVSSEVGYLGRDDSSRDVVAHQQRGTYVGEPYVSVDGTPRVPYARPLYDDNGKQLGLVYVALNLPSIEDLVFATHNLSEDARSFLVGSDGTILSGVNKDYSFFLTKKFDLSIFPPGATIVQGLDLDGHMAYIVKIPVPGTDWFVITTERVEAVTGPIMSLVMTMVVCLLIVIVVGAFVTIFIANSFARPIQALKDNAEQLALGDVDVAITHTGIDEIGQLADSFRHILGNTKGRVDSAAKIASGDVNFKITAVSDKDVERQALIRMRRSIFYMVDQLQTLANRSAEGDLSYRADPSKFQGVYRDLIETMNQTFDLVFTPVQETMRLSTSYSSGDYSDRFNPDVAVKGDFVPFKAALNQVGINSSDTLLKIRTGVDEISEGASASSASVEEIASAVATLAESSSRVSSLSDRNDAGLDQALTAMNDLAHTVGEVAHRTTAVSELISQSSDLAHDGVKRAEAAGKGMEEIMAAAEGQAKTIAEMSSQMEEIGGIVGVISGIAEQTSLLALNAAIEAARAGDAGLGFAVVADEVKSLAQESQTSAEHIENIIGNLQKMSVEMTTGMAKASEVVQSGSNAVNETVTIFHQMAESISGVNQNMSEVAAASEEQAASVQEITASMSEVRDMVQDTAREATDSAAAAEEISAALDGFKDTAIQSAQLAETIVKQVNQFKIE